MDVKNEILRANEYKIKQLQLFVSLFIVNTYFQYFCEAYFILKFANISCSLKVFEQFSMKILKYIAVFEKSPLKYCILWWRYDDKAYTIIDDVVAAV